MMKQMKRRVTIDELQDKSEGAKLDFVGPQSKVDHVCSLMQISTPQFSSSRALLKLQFPTIVVWQWSRDQLYLSMLTDELLKLCLLKAKYMIDPTKP
jgi:hypothetical protein